jgi:hypothetical protein
MPNYQPKQGEETLTDLGARVRWFTDESHCMVEFHVFGLPEMVPGEPKEGDKDPQGRFATIVVGSDGIMEVAWSGDNSITRKFSCIQELRKVASLYAWCYRTAYNEVFHILNVNQLLFK